jgi:hypothetical protein
MATTFTQAGTVEQAATVHLKYNIGVPSGGTDSDGWSQDGGIVTGGGLLFTFNQYVDTTSESRAAPQHVYDNIRYSSGSLSFVVSGLTPNMLHTVRLHFNSADTPNRELNASIAGVTVLSAFNLYQQSGGGYRAIVRDFTSKASAQGEITIVISNYAANGSPNATISGIEVMNSVNSPQIVAGGVRTIDGGSMQKFTGNFGVWSTTAGTLYANADGTILYGRGNSTEVYLRVNNATGTGTISNTSVGTMTLQITSSFPAVPHFPMEYETDKRGVIVVIARDGSVSGRVLGDGKLKRDYKLVFNNRSQPEIAVVDAFWGDHYPHKTFRYYDLWNKIGGTFRFDSKIKVKSNSHSNGSFEVAIAQI